jgi:DNA-binding phage protein
MREQAASDNPVALPIFLSENASSFGATSRLKHASSRWPGCSLARPAAISAVGVADRLAWRTAYAGAAPWIIYTAEMLSATDVLAYRSAEEKLDALRAAVRAAEIKRVARISGVQRSKLQAFVNQGATPHPATIAKILEALDLTQK